MPSRWSIAGVVCLVLGTTACASTGPTFASRFITDGTPTMNVGGIETTVFGQPPARPPAGPLPARGLQHVDSRRSSNLSTVEATAPAVQRALTALAIAPTPRHYLDVATAYTDAGVRDRAFDYLTEGLTRDRQDPALHDALARLWRDWGFPERALSEANLAVYHAPRSAEARNTLGTVLWALGQRDDARRTFTAATALDRDAWYAWRNLCEVALAAGQTADATTLCRRAHAVRRRSTGPRQ